MNSFTLGSDVFLEFNVKVNRRQAGIVDSSGELYKGDRYIRDFNTRHINGRVSGVIDAATFSSTGDYMAKFNVFLDSMGKHEHAIPFKITKSVLGKKRQQND